MKISSTMIDKLLALLFITTVNGFAIAPSYERPTCVDPGYPAEGRGSRIGCKAPFYEGARLKFTCQKDYELIGEKTILCQNNSTWNFPIPVCKGNFQCGNGANVPFSYRCDGVCDCETNADEEDCHAEPTCNSRPHVEGGTWIQSPSTTANVSYLLCNDGYEIQNKDNDRIICSLATNMMLDWTGEWPNCKNTERPTCPYPDSPENGHIANDALYPASLKYNSIANYPPFYVGSQVKFVCNEGFDMVGLDTIQCDSDSKWNSTKPICMKRIGCTDPGYPEDGMQSITGSATHFYVGSKLTFECNDGFQLIGEETIECQSDSTWSYPIPNCKQRIGCTDPGYPEDGMQSITGSATQFYVGSKLTFKCNKGFQLIGEETIECQSDSTWSYPVPNCKQRSGCTDPGYPEDGMQSITGSATPFYVGSKLAFKCNNGFQLIGEETIKCQSDSTWSYPIPNCKRFFNCGDGEKVPFSFLCDGDQDCTTDADEEMCSDVPRCDARPQAEGETWIQSSNQLASVSYLICKNGYELHNKRKDRIICTLKTNIVLDWTGEWPTCRKRITCQDPGPLKDGTSHRTGSDAPFFVGSQMNFTCNDGFTMVGEKSMECRDDGAWDFPKPTCKHTECDPPSIPTNGYLMATDISPKKYKLNDVVYFECNPGFRLRGAGENICTEDGWESEVPICEKMASGKICEQPEVPRYGYISEKYKRHEFQNGDRIEYLCSKGYRLSITNWNKCSNGSWIFRTPKCQEIACRAPPRPEFGDRRLPSGILRINSTAFFSCYDGYSLIGSSSRTCMENGQWNGTLTICTDNSAESCPHPGDPLDGFRTGRRFNVGDKVKFSCESSFTLIGSAIITCQKNLTWDGEAPICRDPEDNDLPKYLNLSTFLVPNPEGLTVVYFVFDSSESVGRENLNISISFARALVRLVGISDHLQVGIVTYGSYARVNMVPLHQTLQNVDGRLNNIGYIGGGTATKSALDEVHKMILKVKSKKENIPVKSVVFLFTDGVTNRGSNPEEKAQAMKNEGVEIFVLGVRGSKSINEQRMARIATSPEHTFRLPHYGQIEDLVANLIKKDVDYSLCGISAREKDVDGPIANGTTSIHWPWMASFKIAQFHPRGGKVYYHCGGSIIHHQWILTAAHCFDSNPHVDNITVTVGMLKLRGLDTDARLELKVMLYHIHQDYHHFDYDVALIKLKSPLVYGKFIRSICLAPEGPSLYAPGDSTTLIGFGKPDIEISPNQLQEVKVIVQDRETCKKNVEKKKAVFTDRMLCASNLTIGSDILKGYGGGPLMKKMNARRSVEQPYWVQVGIASWGLKSTTCGHAGCYNFYTDVAVVKDWIDDTMKKL